MVIYLGFVGCVLVLIGLYEITQKKYWYVIASFAMSVFAGIRYRVGTDYMTYERLFISSKTQTFKDYEGDIGFLFISKLINEFTENIRVHFFVISIFITLMFMICIYKYSEFKLLSVMLYITLGMYYAAFNIVRQYIAIAIVILAINYIGTKSNKKYYCLILLAILFHSTAIIMLPIKILVEKKWTKKFIAMLMILLVGIIVNSDYIINLFGDASRIGRYSDSYYTNVGSNPISFIVNLSIIIFSYMYIKNNKELKENKFFRLMILNAIFLLLSLKGLIFARIASYFSIGVVIFLPNIFKKINKRERNLILYLIIICLLIYMCVYLNTQGNLLPYRIN